MNSEEIKENNPLVSKIRKVLDLKIENDEELLDGLKFLSLYFKDNNIRSRRNLRSVIEKQGIEIRKSVLMECKLVVQQLEEISDIVHDMNENCMQMKDRLNKTKTQTRDLIQQTTALQAEGQKIELKRKIAVSFAQQFQLSPDEMDTLRNDSVAGIDEAFLASLDKLRQVEDHCRLLLRLPNQTAGVEGLENASTLMETAYERLYRWSQRACRQMSGDSCDINLGLSVAISCLQERPVLLKYVLDEFSTARRAACAHAFIDALTSNRAAAAPLEMHTHDPLRYSSDLLACLHQLAAGEREHLRSLLRRCQDSEETELLIHDCLDRICDGLSRPFKMRMEQLLVGEQDILTLYKLNHLLKFYKITLDQQLGHQDSNICGTVDEMQLLSWRLFFSGLKSHSCNMLEKIEIPHHSLTPTAAIQKTLRLLEEILTAEDVSMLPTASNKTELQQMLYTLIDPLLQYCCLSASSLGPVEAAVYLCNCLYVYQSALARYEYTDAKLEQIQGQLDANVDSLVSLQAGFVLRSCGLSALYELLEQQSQLQSQQQVGIDSISPHQAGVGVGLGERVPEATVRKIAVQFDVFLAHPDTLAMPQLALLASLKLRERIRRRAHDLVHSAYSRVFHALNALVAHGNDGSDGHQESAALLPRTPDQVADLILNC